MPKLVTAKLLEPAVALDVSLICREGRPENLLADLALHLLDVMVLDAPVGPQSRIRAYSHALADSSLYVVGARELAERYRKGYPDSLDRCARMPAMAPGATIALLNPMLAGPLALSRIVLVTLPRALRAWRP